MYSSVSSPLPLAKSLFFPMILKPHFCSTLIDAMLSVAARAKNRPIYNKLEHPIERLSRSSSSPELPSKPKGDF